MIFNRLYCNGNVNPIGIGCEIRLSWNYARPDKRNETQEAFQVIAEYENTVFESEVIPGRDMYYDLSDNLEILPGRIYRWRVISYSENVRIVSDDQFFETASEDILNSQWITCGEKDADSPIFEKVFSVREKPAYARAYVAGLGLFCASCNGADCTDSLLLPPNTLYDKFNYLETFDITGLLKKGENVFSVWLGNGYNGDYSQFGYRYFSSKGLRAALVIKYADGASLCINTDDSWTWRNSPITRNSLYGGETYDARTDDKNSKPAVVNEAAAPKGVIIPDEMPPIKIIKEYQPVNSWETPEGTVYDFGYNIQGITKIRGAARSGTEVSLRHSEMIKPDGTPDTETNRGAKAEDVYIFSGQGEECYSPRFTYHGFRYVCVKKTDEISSFGISALWISASVESAGSFKCSSAAVNRIHDLAVRSLRSNFTSIPTDCPVRDERTPCQMDSQMTEEAAIYNFNMYSFYRKWLRDITNTPYRKGEENPDWHGDYIMLSYRIYMFYGDIRPFKALYPTMKQDIERWIESSDEGVIESGFGDWCLPNDNTWATIGGCKTSVNTSLLYAYCCILEKISDELKEYGDKKKFGEWKTYIKNGFYRKCVRDDGSVASRRQTDTAMPLYHGLLDNDDKVIDYFVSKVQKDAHLDTGGFGTAVLLHALASAERLDLSELILNTGSYPGFGYWLSTGATSMWEQWAVKGIMHSHSHSMFAGIDASFYSVFCGIKPLSPAFAVFEVKPELPSWLGFAECRIATVSGDIEVIIEKIYGGLEIKLTVPPNTEAVLTLPGRERFASCELWDGERRIEKKDMWKLGGGVYQYRLVPNP